MTRLLPMQSELLLPELSSPVPKIVLAGVLFKNVRCRERSRECDRPSPALVGRWMTTWPQIVASAGKQGEGRKGKDTHVLRGQQGGPESQERAGRSRRKAGPRQQGLGGCKRPQMQWFEVPDLPPRGPQVGGLHFRSWRGPGPFNGFPGVASPSL